MGNYLQNLNFEDSITMITVIIGVITLIKGIYEYSKAQKWKKAEFLAKEIKEFNSDPNVKNAFLMLDWEIIDISVTDTMVEGIKKFDFNDDKFEKALKHHSETRFTPEEAIIRLIMDAFLFKLAMFQNYIKSNLITTNDLKPYIIYWIEIIGDSNNNRKSQKVRLQLWKYINYYKYDSVIELCKNFGFNIKMDKKLNMDTIKNNSNI